MNKLRRIFTISVMVMTVVVMSGAVVAPTNAAAQAGDLIKMDGLSAVYYLGDDGQRYVFPNPSTYMSWYSDFSGVVTVPSSELQSYPIGGNVTMRPGTNLVKITTDPTVYAVEPGGELRSIVSEENAIDLYGEDWADRVVDVPDSFFVNYEKGSELPTGEYPTGTLVQEEGSSDVYYVDNGEYREFSDESAFLANNFKWSDVITTDKNITPSGNQISGFDGDMTNPAGGATSDGGDVPTGSGLSAALSSSTPAATTIPYNVQGQVYTSVNLTASNDGAVELTGLEVKRTGLGNPGDFEKVYVEVDGERYGNKRTLGSDNTANLYFNTDSSKITVPAGETITLDIVADMDENGTQSGNNALSIVSASAVDTNATVSGSFPITGNLMSISSVGAPTVEYDITTSNTGDVYLGDEQVEVASFDIDNTTANEDVTFSEITLENQGTADNNEVVNYTLYNESDESISGPVDASSDDMIKFVLDESIELEDGRGESFTVKADIQDGREETVILNVDEATDVKAVGLNNGFNAVVTADTNSATGTYTINGGDLNFTEADSNPGDTNVAPLDEDVLFLAMDVESLEEMMTITEMNFDLGNNGNNATSLEAITLYLDGKVVAGPVDLTAGNDTEITFDEEFQVSGTQLLEVKADIADNDVAASGDYNIDFDSANSGAITAENEEGDPVSGDDIKGSAEGAIINVATGTVDLYNDATYGGRTLVAGDDLLVGQYIVEAGDAEGVKIDRYVVGFDTNVTNHVALADINELYISEDDDIETSISGNTNFNVNQELVAGENKVVKVYASFDNDLDVSTADKVVTTLDVEGEGLVSGETLEITEETGQEMTLGTGTLYTDVSAGTPDSAIVIAGTSGVDVAEWEFEAENTSYMMKDIKVTVYSSSTSFTSNEVEKALVTSMTLNGETANVVNGVATFKGPFEVAKDDDLKLNLSATFNGDFNSITSGDVANFAITEYSEKAGNETRYTTLTGVTATPGTNEYDVETLDSEELMYVRNTVPTITASAGSTSTLKTLDNRVMDLSITADAADDVTIKANSLSLIHNVGTAATATVDILDNKGDSVLTAPVVIASNATESLTWDNKIIPAGQTKVYTVSVDFSEAPAEGDSLTVELAEALTWDDGEDADGVIDTEADLINDLSGSFEISK